MCYHYYMDANGNKFALKRERGDLAPITEEEFLRKPEAPEETEEEKCEKKIAELKKALCETDYKAIKYAEGLYTDEEYEPVKRERIRIRTEIQSYREKGGK